MKQPKYTVAATSTTSPIDSKKRMEAFISNTILFSQQVDLSDFIGMDPAKKVAIRNLPYEFRTSDGSTLQKGTTDSEGDTERIFTSAKENISLYVGEGDWSIAIDATHKLFFDKP